MDYFKAINDELGHQAGDDILCRVALWLKAGVRPYDHPGRWGGDEFVVVLSPCDEETLCQIATRIRETIERDSIRTGTPVTVSVGGVPLASLATTLILFCDRPIRHSTV